MEKTLLIKRHFNAVKLATLLLWGPYLIIFRVTDQSDLMLGVSVVLLSYAMGTLLVKMLGRTFKHQMCLKDEGAYYTSPFYENLGFLLECAVFFFVWFLLTEFMSLWLGLVLIAFFIASPYFLKGATVMSKGFLVGQSMIHPRTSLVNVASQSDKLLHATFTYGEKTYIYKVKTKPSKHEKALEALQQTASHRPWDQDFSEVKPSKINSFIRLHLWHTLHMGLVVFMFLPLLVFGNDFYAYGLEVGESSYETILLMYCLGFIILLSGFVNRQGLLIEKEINEGIKPPKFGIAAWVLMGLTSFLMFTYNAKPNHDVGSAFLGCITLFLLGGQVYASNWRYRFMHARAKRQMDQEMT